MATDNGEFRDMIASFPFGGTNLPDPRTLIPSIDSNLPRQRDTIPPAVNVAQMIHTIAEAVAPLIVERVKEMLRQSVPAEQRAIADAARSMPGLETVSLAALADYVEERLGMGELSARVRKMAVEDGDVIVCQYPAHESQEVIERQFEMMGILETRMAEMGRTVICVLLPDDCSMSVLRREDRK